MTSKNKKTWILIGASVATLALAAIAVVTSLRLSSLGGDTAVAPTAPASKPSAALINNGCSTPYSVDPSACNEWCDDDDDCGFVSESSVNSFQSCVDAGNEVLESFPAKCVHGGVTFVEGDEDLADPVSTIGTCVIADGEASGVCRNPAYPNKASCLPDETLQTCNESCTDDAECQGDLVCELDACRHPDFLDSEICEDESLLVCNDTCTEDAECGSGYCDEDSGACRNESCSGESDCSCPKDPIACNQTCESDNDCEGDLICDDPTDTCRNPDCTGEQGCECQEVITHLECVNQSCEGVIGAGDDLCTDNTDCKTTTTTPKPSSTPTPTPEPTLPDAGNTIPTTALLSIGTALLLFGAMSLLAL